VRAMWLDWIRLFFRTSVWRFTLALTVLVDDLSFGLTLIASFVNQQSELERNFFWVSAFQQLLTENTTLSDGFPDSPESQCIGQLAGNIVIGVPLQTAMRAPMYCMLRASRHLFAGLSSNGKGGVKWQIVRGQCEQRFHITRTLFCLEVSRLHRVCCVAASSGWPLHSTNGKSHARALR